MNRLRHSGSRACAVLAVTLLLQQGCSVWRPYPLKPWAGLEKPPALPASYQGYYDYPRAEPAAALISEEIQGGCVRRQYELDLSLPPDLLPPDLEAQKKRVRDMETHDRKTASDMRLNFTNRIDVFSPVKMKPDEKKPVILISPILGGNMVVDHFARYYAGRGWIAVIVHRKRPYLTDGAQDLSGTERYLRTSVVRLRQVIDWLETRPEADLTRLGAFGISYGAILHSVLAAVEPRIRYHVIAMPGAPLPEVIMHCPDKGVSKLVRKAHEEFGWSHEKIQAQLQEHIRTDPIYLAPYVPGGRVEFYLAAFDRVVGARRSWKLWKAMGRPKLKILPFGHYGGILLLPVLQTQSYGAFKRAFRSEKLSVSPAA